MHVALLGDSIFDNGAYTRGEPDVITHLRTLLPSDGAATLFARDGATTADIPRQAKQLPVDLTHVIMAVGGNDAIGSIDLLTQRVSTAGEALLRFDDRLAEFERNYQSALTHVLALKQPTCVCTIYNGQFDGNEARMIRRALAMFNDVIIQAASAAGVGVIELRQVCTEAADYANPIEPSGSGGLKIARAIALSAFPLFHR
jgi:lysophospholipase L1-like esterase